MTCFLGLQVAAQVFELKKSGFKDSGRFGLDAVNLLHSLDTRMACQPLANDLPSPGLSFLIWSLRANAERAGGQPIRGFGRVEVF